MLDLHAEMLRLTEQGDTVWAGWHWLGTCRNGTRLDMRGVMLFGARDDRMVWGHLDMAEPTPALASTGIPPSALHRAHHYLGGRGSSA